MASTRGMSASFKLTDMKLFKRVNLSYFINCVKFSFDQIQGFVWLAAKFSVLHLNTNPSLTALR